MKVLLNFSTLKKGGGQNVALNFLESLDRMNVGYIDFHYVTVKNSDIHKFLLNRGKESISFMPKNPVLRIFKELIISNSLIRKYKIDIVYTYFGFGLYPKSIPQVSGSADSNIFFPEIDFWTEYSGLKKVLKKIIDKYRIWGLKRVSAIVFENEIMQHRCKSLFNIENTIYIKPSINTSYEDVKYNLPHQVSKSKWKGLFLCSWQRNKNFMMIPLLAARLKKKGFDFHFLFTANADNSLDNEKFCELVSECQVENMITITGSIKKEEIRSLYNQVDYVFLLSKLESFSNNIIESWYFSKVLIISDALWSRSLCMDAAIYVERDNVDDIVEKMLTSLDDSEKYKKVISHGRDMLKKYPNIEERTKQELDYLAKIYENY